MLRQVEEFEIVDHGIENSQYFRGCGYTHTEFTDVATGIGNNFAEAIDDCFELLSQQGWDVEDLEKRAKTLFRKGVFPTKPSVESYIREGEDIPDDQEINWDDFSDELYYHVSIRVR